MTKFVDRNGKTHFVKTSSISHYMETAYGTAVYLDNEMDPIELNTPINEIEQSLFGSMLFGGGSPQDTISGGAGNSTLIGGGGNDIT